MKYAVFHSVTKNLKFLLRPFYDAKSTCEVIKVFVYLIVHSYNKIETLIGLVLEYFRFLKKVKAMILYIKSTLTI